MMPTEVQSNPWARSIAWCLASLYILGFFIPVIGVWTGPVLGVWFVLTQKPLRGLAWIFLIAFIPDLIAKGHALVAAGPQGALRLLGFIFATSLLSVMPLTFHRLVSARLPGLLATLPFPCAAVAIHGLVLPLMADAPAAMALERTFLACWLAAALVWMWNQEFRFGSFKSIAILFAALYIPLAGFVAYRWSVSAAPLTPMVAMRLCWLSVAACSVLAIIALLRRPKTVSWMDRPAALAHVQSPFTTAPLRAVRESGGEFLLSPQGERFAVRDGIPVFLTPEDLTGDNGKYNHLYETIGGFYDDTQRVFSAFRGIGLDSYFLNYMSLLDVKAGDSVLETSVGTGLNFKYLPAGVQLSGLDLSAEMLTRCQANLRRWGVEADLYLGNAEHLPFADSTFDVVYTAGALNFFSDRSAAIREMIRVAKPGSQLMIEDETEEYVKSTYEKIPYTSKFYGNREKPVTVPVDLVPAEMQDVRVHMLKDGKFYAITFRKPAVPVCDWREGRDEVVMREAALK